MNDNKLCKDCKRFYQPSWIEDKDLGLCSEDMFGHNQASDKNESACVYFKPRSEEQ